MQTYSSIQISPDEMFTQGFCTLKLQREGSLWGAPKCDDMVAWNSVHS